jgi:hypothetical protein
VRKNPKKVWKFPKSTYILWFTLPGQTARVQQVFHNLRRAKSRKASLERLHSSQTIGSKIRYLIVSYEAVRR